MPPRTPAHPTTEADIGQHFRIIVPGSPVSKNASRIIVRSRLLVTKEAVAYKNDVAKCAKAVRVPYVEDRRWDLTIWYFYQHEGRRQDTNNATELIQDALQGIAYKTDKAVRESHFIPRHDPENPRVEIELVLTEEPFRTGRQTRKRVKI
jgi:Holliday junction resolvase RusA-like endonuclease